MLSLLSRVPTLLALGVSVVVGAHGFTFLALLMLKWMGL